MVSLVALVALVHIPVSVTRRAPRGGRDLRGIGAVAPMNGFLQYGNHELHKLLFSGIGVVFSILFYLTVEYGCIDCFLQSISAKALRSVNFLSKSAI